MRTSLNCYLLILLAGWVHCNESLQVTPAADPTDPGPAWIFPVGDPGSEVEFCAEVLATDDTRGNHVGYDIAWQVLLDGSLLTSVATNPESRIAFRIPADVQGSRNLTVIATIDHEVTDSSQPGPDRQGRNEAVAQTLVLDGQITFAATIQSIRIAIAAESPLPTLTEVAFSEEVYLEAIATTATGGSFGTFAAASERMLAPSEVEWGLVPSDSQLPVGTIDDYGVFRSTDSIDPPSSLGRHPESHGTITAVGENGRQIMEDDAEWTYLQRLQVRYNGEAQELRVEVGEDIEFRADYLGEGALSRAREEQGFFYFRLFDQIDSVPLGRIDAETIGERRFLRVDTQDPGSYRLYMAQGRVVDGTIAREDGHPRLEVTGDLRIVPSSNELTFLDGETPGVTFTVEGLEDPSRTRFKWLEDENSIFPPGIHEPAKERPRIRFDRRDRQTVRIVKPLYWYLDAESTCLKTRNQGGQLSETVRYIIRCRVSEPGRDPVTIRMRNPLLVRIADLDATVAGTANLEIRTVRLAQLRRDIERQATPATRMDGDEEVEGFEIEKAKVRRLFNRRQHLERINAPKPGGLDEDSQFWQKMLRHERFHRQQFEGRRSFPPDLSKWKSKRRAERYVEETVLKGEETFFDNTREDLSEMVKEKITSAIGKFDSLENEDFLVNVKNVESKITAIEVPAFASSDRVPPRVVLQTGCILGEDPQADFSQDFDPQEKPAAGDEGGE